MYELIISSKFKRDARRCARQQKNMSKLHKILLLLESGTALPIKNRDHILSGNWDNHRECHIEPDWLLLYRINEQENAVELVRMGSHSDLFG